MKQTKILVALAVLVVSLSSLAGSAAATTWTGNLGLLGTLKAFTLLIVRTGLWALQCEEEAGEWKLVNPVEHKSEALFVELLKFPKCVVTGSEKATATLSPCSFELTGGEKTEKAGTFKNLTISLRKSCVIKTPLCEVTLPEASNKALKALEVVDVEKSVEFLAKVTNLTDEVKGLCPENKAVKGEGKLEIDEMFASEVKVS